MFAPCVDRHRFRTLCFWLYAEPDVLNPRLDARVDDMIKVRACVRLVREWALTKTFVARCTRRAARTTRPHSIPLFLRGGLHIRDIPIHRSFPSPTSSPSSLTKTLAYRISRIPYLPLPPSLPTHGRILHTSNGSHEALNAPIREAADQVDTEYVIACCVWTQGHG